MVGLKEICDKFDTQYELEGGKQKEAIKKLKTWIEDKIAEAKENFEAARITEKQLDWIVWMYGKVQFLTPYNDENIISRYKEIVDAYDTRAKAIPDERAKVAEEEGKEYKPLTSMFAVVKYDTEV